MRNGQLSMAADFSVADYGWTGKEAHPEAYLLQPQRPRCRLALFRRSC